MLHDKAKVVWKLAGIRLQMFNDLLKWRSLPLGRDGEEGGFQFVGADTETCGPHRSTTNIAPSLNQCF